VFFWRPAIDRYFSYNVYLLANKLMMMMMFADTSEHIRFLLSAISVFPTF